MSIKKYNFFLLPEYFVKALCLLLIYFYRIFLKPFLGGYASCRFDPSCSQYALDAFKEYPVFKALKLTIKRLSKCHPWGSHGYDTLPKVKGEISS